MAHHKASVFTFQKEHLVFWKSNEYKMYVEDKWMYFFCKRVVDIVISLVFLAAVLSWLLPIAAICILLDSPGPVFFLQKRVGRGGRSFLCYKFRSMVMNLDANRKHAVPNDERITRIGRFLRRSNIDEFPQFLNVLKGDMSLVGPRPHMHADHRAFASAIPGYEFRNLVRPGMTGLAQIKGFSGPAESRESIFGRFQWDAFYVRNAGILLDIRIFRRTVLMHFAYLLAFFKPRRRQARMGQA
jgi:putative colanic acid biosynthesis UDP-glucose lipid carrier transferase